MLDAHRSNPSGVCPQGCFSTYPNLLQLRVTQALDSPLVSFPVLAFQSCPPGLCSHYGHSQMTASRPSLCPNPTYRVLVPSSPVKSFLVCSVTLLFPLLNFCSLVIMFTWCLWSVVFTLRHLFLNFKISERKYLCVCVFVFSQWFSAQPSMF